MGITRVVALKLIDGYLMKPMRQSRQLIRRRWYSHPPVTVTGTSDSLPSALLHTQMASQFTLTQLAHRRPGHYEMPAAQSGARIG